MFIWLKMGREQNVPKQHRETQNIRALPAASAAAQRYRNDVAKAALPDN